MLCRGPLGCRAAVGERVSRGADDVEQQLEQAVEQPTAGVRQRRPACGPGMPGIVLGLVKSFREPGGIVIDVDRGAFAAEPDRRGSGVDQISDKTSDGAVSDHAISFAAGKRPNR